MPSANSLKRKFLFTSLIIACASVGLIGGLGVRHLLDAEPTYSDFADYLPYLKPINRAEAASDNLEGKTLLVNFWATWCPPCIEEIPMLDHFNSEFGEQEFQVIGVAFDDPEPVVEFIQQHQVEFLSITGDVTVVDQLMNALGNDQLVLPFSVVFTNAGILALRKFGPFEEAELSAIVNNLNHS